VGLVLCGACTHKDQTSTQERGYNPRSLGTGDGCFMASQAICTYCINADTETNFNQLRRGKRNRQLFQKKKSNNCYVSPGLEIPTRASACPGL